MDISTFFDAVFGDVREGEAILVAYMTETGRFKQFYYTGQELTGKPWYYGLSLVGVKADKATRKKNDCKALALICLDDVIGKYPAPPLEPSYKLETSEGNYQWGYLLAEMADTEEKMVEVENAWRGLCDAGYSDQIATRTRVMRVPGSVHKTGFVARIVAWNPERLFTVQELLDGIGATARPAGMQAVTLATGDPLADWLVAGGGTQDSDGKIHIVCPWSAEHTTGGASASYFPIGYQGRSSRGFRCLHSHCEHRSVHDLAQWAAEQGAGLFTSTSGPLAAATHQGRMAASPRVSFTQLPGIATNKDGGPRMGQPLKMTQLEKMVELLGVKARVNLMTKAVELSAPWGAGTNEVVEVIIEKLQTCGLTVPTRRVYDQLNEWAYCEMYHPIAEALPKWDGVDRFQALTDTIAAQNPELWQLYLRKWLLQAVRAWTSPGSQVGAVLVLAGEQNRGKSRWIKALHPRAMAGRHIDPHNKDTLLESLARPIVELGEIDSTFRKADIAALKAFLTNEEDTYRAPYAPAAKSWPRCTVFAATVNNTKFLVDETGNRRFWPVEVVAVQPDHSIDMMQVWAQAKALLDAGELWYLVGDELTLQMAHAEEHRLKSDVEDLFATWWARVMKSPEPDRKKWPVLNLTTVMRLIGGHSTSQRDRATLARLCDQTFGKKLAVRGNRGWRVPVNKDAYDWNSTQ